MSLNLLRNPLEVMRRAAREYGDIVRIPVILQSRILLNHPDYIQQVLIFQQNKFHKSTLSKEATERLLGQGLLISEGDFWRRQRRLAQPAFHRHRINEYSSAMVECAEAQAHTWRDGEKRNMAEEMMALTLEAAVRTLFGTTLPGEAQQVGRAMTFLMRYSLGRARKPINIPSRLANAAKQASDARLRFPRFAGLPDHCGAQSSAKRESSERRAVDADGRDG